MAFWAVAASGAVIVTDLALGSQTAVAPSTFATASVAPFTQDLQHRCVFSKVTFDSAAAHDAAPRNVTKPTISEAVRFMRSPSKLKKVEGGKTNPCKCRGRSTSNTPSRPVRFWQEREKLR